MLRTLEHNKKIANALRRRGIGESKTKYCPRCKAYKSREEFGTRFNGFSLSYCLNCTKAYNSERQRRYFLRHPELRDKWRRANRRATLKRYHGITIEIYDEIFKKQDGRCAICSGMQISKTRKNLAIDHCHTDNNIRGLLCDSCNLLLGSAKDNIDILRRAIDYLEKAKKEPLGYKSVGNRKKIL